MMHLQCVEEKHLTSLHGNLYLMVTIKPSYVEELTIQRVCSIYGPPLLCGGHVSIVWMLRVCSCSTIVRISTILHILASVLS